jgi:uncharacterized protein YecT (DUF1311 family)
MVISMQNGIFAEEICHDANTQTELNKCSNSEYVKADKELNKVYKEIISGLSKDNLGNLKEAQLSWINFKDKNCYAEKMLYSNGSVAPMVYNFCLYRITKARIKD